MGSDRSESNFYSSRVYSPVSTPADFRQLTPYVFRLALQQSGVDVYIYWTSAIKDIKNDFLKTITLSKEITQDDVMHGKFRGWTEAILRVFAPLL